MSLQWVNQYTTCFIEHEAVHVLLGVNIQNTPLKKRVYLHERAVDCMSEQSMRGICMSELSMRGGEYIAYNEKICSCMYKHSIQAALIVKHSLKM